MLHRLPPSGSLWNVCPRHGRQQRKARCAAGALLRPGLRLRADAGDAADVEAPHLDRAGPGPARPGGALVGLGRVRLADQLHRRRRGPRAPPDVRRDGRLPRGRAGRAERVRRRRPRCSRSPTRSPAGCTSSSSPRRTTTSTPPRPSAGSPAPRSRAGAADRGLVPRRHRAGARLGRSRSRSTSRGRTCSA